MTVVRHVNENRLLKCFIQAFHSSDESKRFVHLSSNCFSRMVHSYSQLYPTCDCVVLQLLLRLVGVFEIVLVLSVTDTNTSGLTADNDAL